MTLAAFPVDYIPHQPAPDGLALSFADVFSRKEMETGPARLRRVASINGGQLDQPFQFTNAEYEYFRAWLEHSIDAGADWFTMPLFLGADYTDAVEARFVKGSISPKRADGGWRVETKLDLTALPVISSDALDAIIGEAGSGLPEWPSQLLANPLDDEFVHVLADPLLRGDDKGAQPDQARIVTVMPTRMSFAWPFTWSDFETFKGYLKWRLSWGQKWQTMPVFRGASFQNLTARFVNGTLKATREGPEWVVRGDLELRDLAPLSLADAAALL